MLSVEDIIMQKESLCLEAARYKLGWFDCIGVAMGERTDKKRAKLEEGCIGTSPPFYLLSNLDCIQTGPSSYTFGKYSLFWLLQFIEDILGAETSRGDSAIFRTKNTLIFPFWPIAF